jgi:hypothetical protein
LAKRKKGKLPEIARFLYRINLDIEATREKAEDQGFICRILEGQPKNKKGKNGIGEPYPLPQYEVTGNELSSNIKIELARKTTQIYVFGKELIPPEIGEGEVFLERIEEYTNTLESHCQQIEAAEEVLNKIAVFSDVSAKFCRETRIYAKTTAMYRLMINSRHVTDHLLDKIEKVYQNEINLAADELLRGNPYQAKNRLNLVLREIDFFTKSLIATARQMNDPRADKWEKEFNNLLQPLNYPLGFARNQNTWFNLGQ